MISIREQAELQLQVSCAKEYNQNHLYGMHFTMYKLFMSHKTNKGISLILRTKIIAFIKS